MPDANSPFATAEIPPDDALAELLGTAFLAYVCDATHEQIEARTGAGIGLPRGQQEESLRAALDAAGLLASHRRAMTVNGKAALEPISDAFARFGEYMGEYQMGLANALRVRAGGSLVNTSRDDPVKAALLTVARDWFPTLLIPQSDDGFFAGMPFGFRAGTFSWGHPNVAAFVRAIGGCDEPLRRFFADGDLTEYTTSLPLMSNSGSGGSLQLGGLAAMIVANAETRVRLRKAMDAVMFLREVETQVDELRALAVGSTVRVPAAVGLGNAQVPPGFRVNTPWGEIVSTSEWHRQQAPAQADLVLLTDYSLTVELNADRAAGQEWVPSGAFFEAHSELERRVELVRLSFLLAVEGAIPAATSAQWRFIADPTTLSGFSWPIQAAPANPVQLGDVDSSELDRWAKLVDERYHPSLRLAVRRTLRSIAERTEPEDGLVDAVIALENMFGTGQSEVGFRLSAALAWLLEDDADARIERQKLVNRLYNLRSKIVHGAEVDATKLHLERVEASRLAVESLRRLFTAFPDLVSAGDQRGKLLVLRGSAPPADVP